MTGERKIPRIDEVQRVRDVEPLKALLDALIVLVLHRNSAARLRLEDGSILTVPLTLVERIG